MSAIEIRKNKTVTVEALNTYVIIIDNEKCLNVLRQNKFEEDYLKGAWSCNGHSMVLTHDGSIYYVIVIKKKERRVVVHECVHMAHQICFHKGIPVDIDNSEIIAYLVDFLVEEVLKITKIG